MLTKHISITNLFQKKKQIGEWRTWNFKGYWKKQAEIPEWIKKEVDFLGVIKKNSWIFHWFEFLVFEIPRGVAQICGISRGERLF